MPTNLKIKQICDGGNYAILKDMSVKRSAYRNANGTTVFIELPEIALLDLNTYRIISFTPSFGRTSVTDPNCNFETFRQLAIDAACSGEAGEPQLLVVSPDEVALCDPTGADQLGTVKLWVYPDPIDNPYEIGLELNSNFAGVLDEDGDSLAINSIDILDWTSTTRYNFRAVVNAAQYRFELGNTFFKQSDNLAPIGCNIQLSAIEIRFYSV